MGRLTSSIRSGAGSVVVLATVVGVLAACGIFGDEEDPPLKGVRLNILQRDQSLKPDPKVADLRVVLPRPAVNKEWPQAGGFANHAMHHLSLGKNPKRVWSKSIGAGSSSSRKVLAQPVVGGGVIFTMDAKANIAAFNAASGQAIWSKDVLPDDEDEGDLGGGVAYGDGRVFVSTGAGEVIALEAKTGKEIWRKKVNAPMRSAPTTADGRVFVVTIENQLIALDAKTGERLWDRDGIAASAGILGGASPAVENSVVVAPLSSGEIVALRTDNGRPLWNDQLAAVRRRNPITNLPDIKGHPVIDRDLVFAVSHSGRLAAIDLRTGNRAWDLDVGALQTPWVAGDYLYIVTTNGLLAAVLRKTGRVRWVIELSKFVDKDDLDDPITWAGPVLAGDRLVIAGSHGKALSVSPYTGEVTGRLEMGEGVFVPPLVANNTIYFLDDDGRLIAMR